LTDALSEKDASCFFLNHRFRYKAELIQLNNASLQ
jgi:hypothetical protein